MLVLFISGNTSIVETLPAFIGNSCLEQNACRLETYISSGRVTKHSVATKPPVHSLGYTWNHPGAFKMPGPTLRDPGIISLGCDLAFLKVPEDSIWLQLHFSFTLTS